MKLFKTTPQPPDGYAILLDNLKQTTAELQNTYANLENVVDPDLIDYYIYQAKAVQMRYKFLLGCVKKIEGITPATRRWAISRRCALTSAMWRGTDGSMRASTMTKPPPA